MAERQARSPESAFRVPFSQHVLNGVIHGFPRTWIKLANLETKVVAEEIAPITVDRPIYVAGLARSGSTILVEILDSHSDVASHKYRDFPAVYTPFWWNRWLDRFPRKGGAPAERAHGDGLAVTAESPEAMEECLWMAFFPDSHNPALSNVLDGSQSHREFEKFYRDHIRKVLLVRSGRRYVSKGNYNISRLEYLQRLFSDARFVLPIRRPVNQIASLMKQHALFTRGETRFPRARSQLRYVGHFEFGLDRCAINVGDSQVVRQIETLWERDDEVRGWARYWAYLYGWIADRLRKNEALRDATLVIQYEKLCANPASQMRRLLDHCQLPDEQPIIDNFAPRIQAPGYYQPQFSEKEKELILEETATVAERFDYHDPG